MAFSSRTVFYSVTANGSEYSFNELVNGMSSYADGNIYYVYKIDAYGVPAVSFH